MRALSKEKLELSKSGNVIIKKDKMRPLSKGRPDLQKNLKEKELLEKELHLKSKVREKEITSHIQLEKELPVL